MNLIGVLRTVSATLPHVTARRGYYLLVSSAAAPGALPAWPRTRRPKSGVEQFGNALRLSWRGKGRGRRDGAPVLDRHRPRAGRASRPSASSTEIVAPAARTLRHRDFDRGLRGGPGGRAIQRRRRKVFVAAQPGRGGGGALPASRAPVAERKVLRDLGPLLPGFEERNRRRLGTRVRRASVESGRDVILAASAEGPVTPEDLIGALLEGRGRRTREEEPRRDEVPHRRPRLISSTRARCSPRPAWPGALTRRRRGRTRRRPRLGERAPVQPPLPLSGLAPGACSARCGCAIAAARADGRLTDEERDARSSRRHVLWAREAIVEREIQSPCARWRRSSPA